MSRWTIPLATFALVASLARAEPDPSAVANGAITPTNIRALQQTAADWQRWLSGVAPLREYLSEFSLATPRATDDALSRGKRSRANADGWQFIDGPFEWTVGERVYWIVDGRARDASILAVFTPHGDAPEHRASLVIAERDAPLAIGWNASRPDELLFTTCYGCPGAGGSIALSADGQPTFVYR